MGDAITGSRLEDNSAISPAMPVAVAILMPEGGQTYSEYTK